MKYISMPFLVIFMILLVNCTSQEEEKRENIEKAAGTFRIGWASVDVTPDKPVLLEGQWFARISEGIMDPITATVLAFDAGVGETSPKVLMISCDFAAISDGRFDGAEDNFRNVLRRKITEKISGLSPEKIIINATHTHAAPIPASIKDASTVYGVELDAMSPHEYLEYASEHITRAAEEAWKNRTPMGISYGLGHAVVGHNRMAVDVSGTSHMYGITSSQAFSHIEGYEDHSVNLLYTWDQQTNLTGVVINVACPAQVSEASYFISSDYWHDARVELWNRLGEHLFILPQISFAGDQSPHVLVGRQAEERMQKLMFPDVEAGRGSLGRRKQIAVRIADAVTSVLPYMKENIEWDPVFVHRMEVVELSQRLIDIEEVHKANAEMKKWKNRYDQLMSEIRENPEIRNKARWYTQVTGAYMRASPRFSSLKERYELQKSNPKIPVEVHVVRIGDIVIATNPKEVYLDYGVRIKARSPAMQTFLVQHTGSGLYLPTSRAVKGSGFGANVATSHVGPEGGQELVERTLELISLIMN